MSADYSYYCCISYFFSHTALAAHAMKGNTVLTELSLERCNIDSSDIAHLRLALKDIHTLAVLNLSGNTSIGNNGIKEIGICFH